MSLVSSFTAIPGMFTGPDARVRTRKTACGDRAWHDMLQLYRTNLEVRLECIEEECLSQHQRQIFAKVAEGLARPAWANGSDHGSEWDEVYKLERLTVLLLNGPQLRQELARRVAELADEKIPEADRLQREHESLIKAGRNGPLPATDDGVPRALLLRVVEVLQLMAKRKYLAKPIRKGAIKKLLCGVVVGFLLLVAPFVALSTDYTSQEQMISKWWSHFPLYSALIAGGLGAFFSRLIQLQRDWAKMPLEEVCAHSEGTYLGLRAGVGMCGALILYYFFQSGLIDGGLFPHVEKFGINLVEVAPPAVHMAFATPSKDLALLTVWCFLGGFSEVLVPGILAKTERQVSQAGVPDKAGPSLSRRTGSD